jgi:hypothetical protein
VVLTGRAERQREAAGTRVERRKEIQSEFFVVRVPGAAAERAGVLAAEVVVGMHGGRVPLLHPVLAVDEPPRPGAGE